MIPTRASRMARPLHPPVRTLLVGAAALFAYHTAHAQTPPQGQPSAAPTSVTGQYSPYEQQSIEAALEALHTRLARDPEGKPVESIEVVTLEVVEPRDPAPGF